MGFASYSKRASQGVATVARAIHLIHLARAEPGRHLGRYQIIDSTRLARSVEADWSPITVKVGVRTIVQRVSAAAEEARHTGNGHGAGDA